LEAKYYHGNGGIVVEMRLEDSFPVVLEVVEGGRRGNRVAENDYRGLKKGIVGG
jgi:hypothetical protein